MTRQESENRAWMYDRLYAMGLNYEECETLRRASMTLHSWAERECNGDIQRDEDTGKPYHVVEWNAHIIRDVGGKPVHLTGQTRRYPVADRERGALDRIRTIIERHKGLWYYHQGDPRGAQLYIGKLSDARRYVRRCAHPSVRTVADALYCNYSSLGVAVY